VGFISKMPTLWGPNIDFRGVILGNSISKFSV